jgi:RNA polymerase sigma-70 factor (ECF subfamily)
MPDYEEIRATLVRAVASLCPGWMTDRRDDLVQQAMMKLLRHEEKGELNPAPKASYLWKVAHSVTVDEIRSVRRKRETSLDSAESEPNDRLEDERAGQDRAMWELGHAIRECLGTLESRRRRVVALHILGHSLPETAEHSGWRYDQVRNILYRGLKQLRFCLTGKGFAP